MLSPGAQPQLYRYPRSSLGTRHSQLGTRDEAAFSGNAQCPRARVGAGRAALGEAVEAADAPRAAERDQGNLLAIARLEADGGARRDVEPHPERRRAVEAQRAVDLEEVEM